MENHPKNSYTSQEKVAILKRYLVEKKSVPDLCDEYHLHPTVFYRWLKTFFENGTAAFGPPPRAEKQVEAREQRIAFLEAKLKRKDEVLAELMEEHVALKKSWGDLKGQWVPHDTRDQVIDFVRRWSGEIEIAVCTFIFWLRLATSKFYGWQERWPAEYDQYWEVLMRRHGKQPGTRQMVELLGLGKKHGYDRLQEAVCTALATGCGDAAAVRYLLTAESSLPPPLEGSELGSLARYERPLPGVQTYDQLLRREVAL